MDREKFLKICEYEDRWKEAWNKIEKAFNCSSLFECDIFEYHGLLADTFISTIMVEWAQDLYSQFMYESPYKMSDGVWIIAGEHFSAEYPLEIYDDSGEQLIKKISSYNDLYDYITENNGWLV